MPLLYATDNHFMHAARPLLSEYTRRDFKSAFGVSPEVSALAWNLLDFSDAPDAQPKHLLWALIFLKAYTRESVLCGMAGVCRKTLRKRIWPMIRKIAGLGPSVVSLCVLST